MLSELRIGELSYTRDAHTQYLAVTWGFAEVLPDRVIVMAQTAERAEEIDVERAERAKQRAEDRLKKIHDLDIDFERARAALQRALTRIQSAQKERR